jgi:hypothetical protein
MSADDVFDDELESLTDKFINYDCAASDLWVDRRAGQLWMHSGLGSMIVNPHAYAGSSVVDGRERARAHDQRAVRRRDGRPHEQRSVIRSNTSRIEGHSTPEISALRHLLRQHHGRQARKPWRDAVTSTFGVGDEGFEPPTPCASCKCSNQLS